MGTLWRGQMNVTYKCQIFHVRQNVYTISLGSVFDSLLGLS